MFVVFLSRGNFVTGLAVKRWFFCCSFFFPVTVKWFLRPLILFIFRYHLGCFVSIHFLVPWVSVVFYICCNLHCLSLQNIANRSYFWHFWFVGPRAVHLWLTFHFGALHYLELRSLDLSFGLVPCHSVYMILLKGPPSSSYFLSSRFDKIWSCIVFFFLFTGSFLDYLFDFLVPLTLFLSTNCLVCFCLYLALKNWYE